MRSVTIQSIAAKARVSKSTVSLVLNGRARNHRISPETEKRVRKIVRDLGYRPNQVARAFRLKRTRTIGVVIPDLANWFFAQLMTEFERVARKNRYQILIASSDDDGIKEKAAVDNLLDRSVDGLVVASVMKKIPKAGPGGVPTIHIDREVSGKNAAWVTSDNVGGAYHMVDHLLGTGIQELYFIGGLETLSTSRGRLKGFRNALKSHGITCRRDWVRSGPDFSPESGYRLMKAVVRDKGEFPQAVFCASFTLLEGVLKYMREQNRLFSEGVRLATFDDHPLLETMGLRISSVRQDSAEIAAVAFELLESAMQGKPISGGRVIEPEVILRG